MVIYAGTQGFLDDVPQGQRCWRGKKNLLEYTRHRGSELKKELQAKKDLTPELEAKLVELIKKFNSVTQVGKKAAAA